MKNIVKKELEFDIKNANESAMNLTELVSSSLHTCLKLLAIDEKGSEVISTLLSIKNGIVKSFVGFEKLKNGGIATDFMNGELECFKPILYPFSEIKRFDFSEKQIKDFYEVNENNEVELTLIKEHIDFNLLIERGLAIDVNTLNENPYLTK